MNESQDERQFQNSERFYAIPAIAKIIKKDKINLCEFLALSKLEFGISG